MVAGVIEGNLVSSKQACDCHAVVLPLIALTYLSLNCETNYLSDFKVRYYQS